MNDLVSRQAAIELVRDVCNAIMSGCDSYYDPETDDEVYKDLREVDAILKCNKEIRIALRNMPSAEPERKKGKWIGYNSDNSKWQRDDGSPIFLICSECGKSVLNNGSAYWNFCPNCGSYNGGEEDE